MKKLGFLMAIMLLFSMLACDGNEKEEFVGIPDGNTSENTGLNGNELNLQRILDLVNDARQSGVNCKGTYYPPVAPLKWNNKLESAAFKHSKDMAAKNYFSHTSKDGRSFGERIKEEGYTFSAAAENIAMGQPTEEAVVDAWLNSQGHCANIMSNLYTEMGVGRQGAYWTQDFAKPRN